MAQIKDLTNLDTILDGDQIPLYSQVNGETRRVSASTLASYVGKSNQNASNSVTVYVNPTATGFSAPVGNISSNVWLRLTPSGAFAAGTIVLPPITSVVDGQIIKVTSTNSVSTLDINTNDGSINITGQPNTLAANGFFTIQYDIILKTWVRVA